MTKKENLAEVVKKASGMPREEFDKIWTGFEEEARKVGLASPEEIEGYVDVNAKRFFRKILMYPSVEFKGQLFIGMSKLTNWAEIMRKSARKNPANKGVPDEKLTYQSGNSKGQVIPKDDYQRDYYFYDEGSGELYTLAGRGEFVVINDATKFHEGTYYDFRAVKQPRKDGKGFNIYPTSYTSFAPVGTIKSEEMKKKFRVVNLADVGMSSNLPSVFVLNVTVVDNQKTNYGDKVLVEDESIKDDITTNYFVTFDSGIFKVPENGKATIFVKPVFDNGVVKSFEGLSYISDDKITPDKLTEEEWESSTPSF